MISYAESLESVSGDVEYEIFLGESVSGQIVFDYVRFRDVSRFSERYLNSADCFSRNLCKTEYHALAVRFSRFHCGKLNMVGADLDVRAAFSLCTAAHNSRLHGSNAFPSESVVFAHVLTAGVCGNAVSEICVTGLIPLEVCLPHIVEYIAVDIGLLRYIIK